MLSRELIVHKLAGQVLNAADIPALGRSAGVRYTEVGTVCWPEAYPYKPSVAFAAVHTGDALLLHYRVEEQSVRAVNCHDQEHIWEDSCVELFLMPSDDGLYYNFECSCTGRLLLAVGKGRTERQPAPQAVMQSIDRWASLGSEPFGIRNEPTKWEVALRVPAAALFRHQLRSFDGLRMRGNVYKCGDLLPVPHFVSWSPIATEKPDFHRPEYFGQIAFHES